MEATAIQLNSAAERRDLGGAAPTERFASECLARAAQAGAAEMITAEEKTRALAPCAYRLSLLPESTVDAVYKQGKEYMSADDLLRYMEETRSLLHQAEEDEPQSDGESDPCEEVRAVAVAEPVSLRAVAAKGRELVSRWIDVTPNTVKSEKKFPLSAFAAVIAIAVSMMLIVTGALMVTTAEAEISSLNSEISSLTNEVEELETKLETRSDLMEIRRIATEEYGMVDQQYLRMQYIPSKESLMILFHGPLLQEILLLPLHWDMK